MENEKIVCPACKSDKIRNFVYGLLKFQSDEDMRKFQEKHIPVGCIIMENSPAFHCDNCGKNFGNYNELRKEK